MNKLESMQIFIRVAELASFTKAAENLGLPKSSVSASVQQLENHLGTRLLQRTTRRVHLTQDGTTFYERCKDLLADVDELEALFQRGPAQIGGRLRVDMSVGLAKNLVIPRLPEFLRQYPNIELELGSSDRRVDVIREGFDCVVRVGDIHELGLIARPLGQMEIINCVSPAYIQTYGEPKTIDELSHHRLVHYSTVLGAKPEGFEYFDGSGYRMLDMPSGLTVNNTEAYMAACLAGLGIIQRPRVGVLDHLASGQLVEVLKDCPPEPMPVSLIYPNRRNQSRRVQVFMDWMAGLVGEYVRS